MPKKVKDKSQTEVNGLREVRLHHVRGPLKVDVKSPTDKLWVAKFTVPGTGRRLELGGIGRAGPGHVPLEAAYRKALALRDEAIATGGNPRKAGNASAANVQTFRALVDAYEADNRLTKWESDRDRKRWRGRLEKHVLPVLGDMPVDKITVHDVIRVLRPIWVEKQGTSRKLRTYLNTLFKRAHVLNMLPQGDPLYAVEDGLPERIDNRKNRKMVDWRIIPDAWNKLKADDQTRAAVLCSELALLTTTRPGEARLAVWEEVDFEKRIWVIPPERMTKRRKGQRREHRIPLSSAALDILAQAKALFYDKPQPEGSPRYIFPGQRPGRPLSDAMPSKVLKQAGITDADAHGLRASFRTWCQDHAISYEIAEASLSHSVGDRTVAAYARSDVFDLRRPVIEQWAAFVIGQATASANQLGMVGA